jgi:hypothetical protein
MVVHKINSLNIMITSSFFYFAKPAVFVSRYGSPYHINEQLQEQISGYISNISACGLHSRSMLILCSPNDMRVTICELYKALVAQ